MKLSIKNMVCPRCVDSVTGIVNEMRLPVSSVELGFVLTERPITEAEQNELESQLKARGFELIFDRESELVSVVKSSLSEYIRHLESDEKMQKLSVFISSRTNYNYSYLSKVFSDATGETIETHLIQMKIERVKELLSFRKWTLSEIAWKLKYSSVQYLSNQFKKVTGQTVTEYRKSSVQKRKTLDSL